MISEMNIHEIYRSNLNWSDKHFAAFVAGIHYTLLAMPLGAITFKIFCPRTLEHADDCQKTGSEALSVLIPSWIFYPQQRSSFLGFLCFVLQGSHGLMHVWDIVACVSDVDWGEEGFPITPGLLLPAALLGKYSTLGTDRLLRHCHREHLVMAFWARTPAEIRVLSVPCDLPMSLCISAGALGYVKHRHIWPR